MKNMKNKQNVNNILIYRKISFNYIYNKCQEINSYKYLIKILLNIQIMNPPIMTWICYIVFGIMKNIIIII